MQLVTQEAHEYINDQRKLCKAIVSNCGGVTRI